MKDQLQEQKFIVTTL